MFKLFWKSLLVVVAMHLFSGISLANSVSYSYAFSDSSRWVYIECFNRSVGTLNSVTYSITDMSLFSNIILDLDDNDGPLSINNGSFGYNIGVNRPGTHIVATLFQLSGGIVGNFTDDDDGDSVGSHNGGNDELISSNGFLNLSGSESSTDSDHLEALYVPTGFVSCKAGVVVGPILKFAFIPAGRTIETYWEDQYSGDLTVTYDYTPVPAPAAVILFGSGIVGLGAIRKTSRKK